MEVAPLLPPIPIPNAFQLPAPILEMPSVKPLEWAPIPPRVGDIPEPKAPQTEPKPEPTEEPKTETNEAPVEPADLHLNCQHLHQSYHLCL